MFKQIHQEYKKIIPPVWRIPAQIIALVLVVAIVAAVQFINTPTSPLAVHFYDVGQGDAIHIRTAEGFDVLIDGGPDDRIIEKLGQNMPFWDRTIELMILTHPHADHLVGQLNVLDRFEVKRVVSTGVLHTTDEYISWLQKVKERGIPAQIARAGTTFEIRNPKSGTDSKFQIPNSKIEVLWPIEDLSGKRVVEKGIGEGGGLNDTSIVARLVFGKTSFLFTGDIGDEVERELLSYCHPEEPRTRTSSVRDKLRDEGSPAYAGGVHSDGILPLCTAQGQNDEIKSDILKVAHHGSKYSSSEEFLRAVNPKYAVIQVKKKNDFGHPHFQTLWRLKQAGAEILRVDKDGDISFVSDGINLEYQTGR